MSYLQGIVLTAVGPCHNPGFVADALKGADISLFIGLPVAGVLYYVLAKSIDVEAETRIAMEDDRELEQVAGSH